MKFEKTSIPVFTGVDKLKQVLSTINVDEDYYISAVKPGIDCLIANGYVCDLNGKPFENDVFQSRFKWFSEKLQKSNFVGIGRVIIEEKRNYRNANDHNLYSLIGYRRPWSANSYDDIFIELHDIHQPISKFEIRFDVRSKVMEGMSRTSYPNDQSVVLPKRFDGNQKSIADIVDFAYENSKNGLTTLFQDKKAAYIQGTQGVLRNFEIDLFETIEGIIESVKTSELMVNTRNRMCNVVDFIRVRYKDSIYSISIMKCLPETVAYMNDLVESGKIKFGETPYKFKAIKINGELKLPTKL